MPEVTVIADTSPLLYLHQIGCLNLLERLYGGGTIPRAVANELEAGRNHGFEVPAIDTLPWIRVRPVSSGALLRVVTDLGPGEGETLALGLEIIGGMLILDDRLARRIADFLRLKFTGTLGVLIRAKGMGLISSASEAISELRKKGMWLSEALVRNTLRLAGE